MIQITAKTGKAGYKTTLQNDRHEILSDEPEDKGGSDLGPAPSELLCGALAACTTITLRMYADRKQWDLEEIKVEVSLERDKTQNVTRMQCQIELTGDLTDEQRERLMEIADKCPVHWSLTHPVQISSKMKTV